MNQMYLMTASQLHSPYGYPSKASEVLSISQCIPSTSNPSRFTTGDYFDHILGLPIFYFLLIMASQLIKDPSLKFYLMSVFYTKPGAKYFDFGFIVRDSECRRYTGEWLSRETIRKWRRKDGILLRADSPCGCKWARCWSYGELGNSDWLPN